MSRPNLDTHRLALLAAKEDILNRRAATNWAVFAYEKYNELKLLDSGAGGVDELARKFSSNSIMYGLCRVQDPSSGQPRIILINWVGEKVPESYRQTCAGHLPAIKTFFREASLVLSARHPDEVTQEGLHRLLSQLAPVGGAVSGRVLGSSSEELVGTNYRKTNPALEIHRTKRESFWAQAEREEEQRKEEERRRLLEQRKRWERERMEEEKREAAERERKFQEKEKLIEEQRKEQARLEAEARRKEKARWEQQQREHEEAMRDRFQRSESIEKAVEAAVLVSQRSQNPRDFFRQQEHFSSTSSSQSPPSPLGARPGAPRRPYLRYQRSLTESAYIFRRPEPPTSPGDFLQAPSSPRSSEPSSIRAAPLTSSCRPTPLPPTSSHGSTALPSASLAGTGPLSPSVLPGTKDLPHISPEETMALPPISLAEPSFPSPASPLRAGSPPPATPPRARSPPPTSPPTAGSPPPATLPTARSPSPADFPLPATPPRARSPPSASPPTAGSPLPATLPTARSPSPVDFPLPATPSRAGFPPPATLPRAGSPAPASPPRAESPAPDSHPRFRSPSPASPRTAGSPPPATLPRAGSPAPASPPRAESPAPDSHPRFRSPSPASPRTAGSPPPATLPRAGSPAPASPPRAESPAPDSHPRFRSPSPASPRTAGSPPPATLPRAGSPAPASSPTAKSPVPASSPPPATPPRAGSPPPASIPTASSPLLSQPPATSSSPVSLPLSSPEAVSPSPPTVPAMAMEEDAPHVAATAFPGPSELVPAEEPHGSLPDVQTGPLLASTSALLAGWEPAQRCPVLSTAGSCSLESLPQPVPPWPWHPATSEAAAPMLSEDPVADGVTPVESSRGPRLVPQASPAEPFPVSGHNGLAGQEAGRWPELTDLVPRERGDVSTGAKHQLQASWDPTAGGTAWCSQHDNSTRCGELEGGETAESPSLPPA